MYSVIVVPDGCRGPDEQFRLEPGETLRFGRTDCHSGCCGVRLLLPHPHVSRSAGELTATGAFWTLSNFSRERTYTVVNPESADERITVAPGRADAPVPFEFARVILATATATGTDAGADGEPCGFDVWAPRHDYLEGPADDDHDPGEPMVRPFPLDRTKRYFLVLAALCEPRLRDERDAPLPTVEQIVERVRPHWPEVNHSAVHWNLDYLTVKLRLKPPQEHGHGVEALVLTALRLDLVREEQLGVLEGRLPV
ncbi:FHA domain-containing protein [Streptomyces sp. NPDC054796]